MRTSALGYDPSTTNPGFRREREKEVERGFRVEGCGLRVALYCGVSPREKVLGHPGPDLRLGEGLLEVAKLERVLGRL